MTLTEEVRRVGADPRFKVRGPYWVPGLSVLVEPWAAVATTNVGTRVQLYGRSSARALEVVRVWQLLTERGGPIDSTGVRAVSAAVVNPRGDVTASWALDGAWPPVPGGEPRWTPLHRVVEPVVCLGCAQQRWPGCWMPRSLRGCSACLPELEAADPRVWPFEPPAPGARVEAAREKTPRSKRASKRVEVVSPSDSRLF